MCHGKSISPLSNLSWKRRVGVFLVDWFDPENVTTLFLRDLQNGSIACMEPLFIRVPHHGFGRNRLQQLAILNSVTMRLGASGTVFLLFITKKPFVIYLTQRSPSVHPVAVRVYTGLADHNPLSRSPSNFLVLGSVSRWMVKAEQQKKGLVVF